MGNNITYPYLVVRWMGSVYQTVPVVLVPPGSALLLPKLNVNGVIQQGDLSIPDPAPTPGTDYKKENEWTVGRRAAMIDVAIILSKRMSKNVCAVFGGEDSVYVDPTGRQQVSNQPPSGGMDPGTGSPYSVSNLSYLRKEKGSETVEATEQEQQYKGSQATLITAATKKSLVLYIEKGEIACSILYLSKPNDDPVVLPILREYLEKIKDVDTSSNESLWKYIIANGICDTDECSRHQSEGTDPEFFIGNLDEEVDGSSWEAEEWNDKYYMDESSESLAFHFLEDLMIEDVPGVALVKGDRPGSNLTFVEIRDSTALKELKKVLDEEGYEIIIERF